MIQIRPRLLNGPVPAGELVKSLGVSRAALSKAYERESAGVLRFGRGPGSTYAARERFPGLDTDEFPVFRVDQDGKARDVGRLITLVRNETVWLPGAEVSFGLPPEINDAAPRGFLGRSFARRHEDLGLPEDVTLWSDHHALAAISRRGEDLPGNLVLGRESFDRLQRLQQTNHGLQDFDQLAELALAGEHAGSSAGGEQPKFTVLLDGVHRIVKFASSETENARRWRDLLQLEHLALETLAQAGVPVATNRLHDTKGGLKCLIVDRFDRMGERGRINTLSLAAASGELVGSWTDAAYVLNSRRMLHDADLRRVALLDAFGAQIANTDRHMFNIALFEEDGKYLLAPAFDQLPMAYAPPASGHLRRTLVDPAVPAVNTLQCWDEATELARTFWHEASGQSLSDPMMSLVRAHARRLDQHSSTNSG